MTQTQQNGTTLEPLYNGLNDRVAQVSAGVTTTFALDSASALPEVIYTSDGEAYLHLPGVIVTEKAGQVRYLLSDGLGSARQAVDETAGVVAYYEFDPYGTPVDNTTGGEPYGFTGEWYEGQIDLLHLRARWYLPESGTFLSQDSIMSEPPYLYAGANPINRVDPSGYCPPIESCLEGGDLDFWLPLREMWRYAEESIHWAREHPAQAWGLPEDSLKMLMLEDWLFERGRERQRFDTLHPITQLVMQHGGVKAARTKFYQTGCRSMTGRNAFRYTVEGPPYLTIEIPELNTKIIEQVYQIEPPDNYKPILKKRISLGGAYKFARGNIILFYEIFTGSDDTLETIDGTLGSYRVEVINNGGQTATFEVYNKTGRESFTRDYLYPPLAFF